MKIIGITMIANEGDIIEVILRRNFEYFDYIIVVCNPSVDGTEAILEALSAEGLPIILWKQPRNVYNQDGILSAIYIRAEDMFPNAVLMVFDGDELILGNGRKALEAAISCIPDGHVGTMPWCTYLPPADGRRAAVDEGLRPFDRRLISETMEIVKVIKPATTITHPASPVPRGTHHLVAPDGSTLPTYRLPGFVVAHIPVRSLEQVTAKSLIGWAAKAMATTNELGPEENRHWIEIVRQISNAARPSSTLTASLYAGLGTTILFAKQKDEEIKTEGTHLPVTPVTYPDLFKRADFGNDITARLIDVLLPRPSMTDALKKWPRSTDCVDSLTSSEGILPEEQHFNELKCDWPPFEYLFNRIKPNRVIDIGCGLGAYLALIRKRYGASITGVDGSIWGKFHEIDASEYVCVDLSQEALPDLGASEAVICTEVLEHVPEERAVRIVDWITRTATNAIVFSVGQPGQPGYKHINLKPLSWWLRMFEKSRWYVDFDSVWGARFVSSFHWFRKNILVFKKYYNKPNDYDENLEILMRLSKQMGPWPELPPQTIIGFPGDGLTYPVSSAHEKRAFGPVGRRKSPSFHYELYEKTMDELKYQKKELLCIQKKLETSRGELENKNKEIERIQKELLEILNEYKNIIIKFQEIKDKQYAILHSRSWKITAPMRHFVAVVHSIRRKIL